MIVEPSPLKGLVVQPDKPAEPLQFKGTPLLSPSSSWRILRRRTGIPMGRATFYRWLNAGRILYFRMGARIYIPLTEIDDLVKRCRTGERF